MTANLIIGWPAGGERMSRRHRWGVLAASLLGLALLAQSAVAARLIRMSVQLDGKPILTSMTDDDAIPGPYTVWRYLKSRPFKAVKDVSLQPEADNPLKAVLRGKVRVVVEDCPAVETSELTLTRKSEQGNTWFLDPEWVEAHGPPGNASEEWRRIAWRRHGPVVAIFAVGFGLVFGLAALLVRLATHRTRVAKWGALTGLVLSGAALILACVYAQLGSGYASDMVPLQFAAGGGVVLAGFVAALSRSRASGA